MSGLPDIPSLPCAGPLTCGLSLEQVSELNADPSDLFRTLLALERPRLCIASGARWWHVEPDYACALLRVEPLELMRRLWALRGQKMLEAEVLKLDEGPSTLLAVCPWSEREAMASDLERWRGPERTVAA